MIKNTSQEVLRRLSTTVVLVSVLALGACASGVKLDDVTPKNTGSASPTSKDFANNPWNDPNSPLYQKSFYFDFDNYTVKSADQSKLDAHAKYLNSNKAQKIAIQGNTDDQGTTEYNLALGQKRSDAVKKVLSLLGVSDSQIETISFGKEKPKSTATDDASRAENRRADIVYQDK